MRELANITITVGESETEMEINVRGFANEKLDKWDRAHVVGRLCKCLNITPQDAVIWSLAYTKVEEASNK